MSWVRRGCSTAAARHARSALCILLHPSVLAEPPLLLLSLLLSCAFHGSGPHTCWRHPTDANTGAGPDGNPSAHCWRGHTHAVRRPRGPEGRASDARPVLLRGRPAPWGRAVRD
jgi:hypothetical protein